MPPMTWKHALILLALAGPMASCGEMQFARGYPSETVAPEILDPYLAEFYTLAAPRGPRPVVIEFGETAGDALGTCRPRTRHITLSPELLTVYSEHTLRYTLFHELVHCSLGVREHTEGTLMGTRVPDSDEEMTRRIDEYFEN